MGMFASRKATCRSWQAATDVNRHELAYDAKLNLKNYSNNTYILWFVATVFAEETTNTNFSPSTVGGIWRLISAAFDSTLTRRGWARERSHIAPKRRHPAYIKVPGVLIDSLWSFSAHWQGIRDNTCCSSSSNNKHSCRRRARKPVTETRLSLSYTSDTMHRLFSDQGVWHWINMRLPIINNNPMLIWKKSN